MKPESVLCLALVLSGGLLGCSTDANYSGATASSGTVADETLWQLTLRNEVTNGFRTPPMMAGGVMFYSVPPEAAKILENRPPEELLPFLAKLRTEPPAWKADVVGEWIIIVRDGLRGQPAVYTSPVTTTPGGVSLITDAVYQYEDHLSRNGRKQP